MGHKSNLENKSKQVYVEQINPGQLPVSDVGWHVNTANIRLVIKIVILVFPSWNGRQTSGWLAHLPGKRY